MKDPTTPRAVMRPALLSGAAARPGRPYAGGGGPSPSTARLAPAGRRGTRRLAANSEARRQLDTEVPHGRLTRLFVHTSSHQQAHTRHECNPAETQALFSRLIHAAAFGDRFRAERVVPEHAPRQPVTHVVGAVAQLALGDELILCHCAELTGEFALQRETQARSAIHIARIIGTQLRMSHAQ